jgi:chemotaxis protein CheD
MKMEVEAPARRVVGIAEIAISADPGETLITYALGSCLGITVYDPLARVGGLLHAMLPENPGIEDGETRPARFVHEGVPLLFKECYRLGARKERMQLHVAGGAAARATEARDLFQIGRRNMVMLRQLLWKNGVLISGEDVGGSVSRTLSLEIATGAVRIRSGGTERVL